MRVRHLPGAVPVALHQRCRRALEQATWRLDTVTGASFRFETSDLVIPELDLWLQDTLAQQAELPSPLRMSWKRLTADRTHRFPWHRDHRKGGAVGVVVNLSRAPVDGGVFEGRLRWETEPAVRICSAPRDVHLFSVDDPHWVHRVTPVRGAVAREVYAGWAGG